MSNFENYSSPDLDNTQPRILYRAVIVTADHVKDGEYLYALNILANLFDVSVSDEKKKVAKLYAKYFLLLKDNEQANLKNDPNWNNHIGRPDSLVQEELAKLQELPAEEFDKQQFEELMHQAVMLNGSGKYEEALSLSSMAYLLAPDGSAESGRAARDNAFRLNHLDRVEEADSWAIHAFEIHDANVLRDRSIANLRERAATEDAIKRIELNKAQKAYLNGESYDMWQAYSMSEAAKLDLSEAKNKKLDQYQINSEPSDSIAATMKALFDRDSGQDSFIKEDFKKGRKLGFASIRHAFMSETPLVDNRTPKMSLVRHAVAMGSDFVKGISGTGANALLRSKNKRLGNFAVRYLVKLAV